MVTLLIIILVIGILVLVHEWGHFYSARRFGVRVDEFGFGFPPRVASITRNNVRYSFNLLPLGGFVKIFGEQGEGEADKESFASRPAWQRFVMLAAGVFMNLVTAWVFFSVGAAIGIPQIADDAPPEVPVSIIAITPGSPAEKAGLKLGDEVLELRKADFSLRIESERDIRDFVDAYRGEEMTLTVRRGGEVSDIKATPRANFPEGDGPLGVGLGKIVLERSPLWRAPFDGLFMLSRSVILTLDGFVGIVRALFSRGAAEVNVSGPVGIFFFAEDTRALGAAYFLQFIALLSVNLAILNFLPIPALDGGRIFFLLIEKIKGSKIRPEIEGYIHTLGFVFLILLMILVTYKDVTRIW